jgi:polyisoprenoid-binding protein YceI
MIKYWIAGLTSAAALGLAACGAPSTTSPTTTTAPTVSAPPTLAAAPTLAPAPTSVPATVAPAAAASQSVRLVLDAQSSQASYRAREQLVGQNLPNEAVGTTKKVTGTIVIDPSGDVVDDQSTITVDLTALQSNESRRDNFIKGNTLNTNQFPNAVFVVRDVQGLSTPLPTTGQATFQLNGDLTVRGVTRPVTWQVTATFGNGGLTGNATTSVKLTDFGMTPPKAGPVLSIEDQLNLELDFAASPQA